MVDAVAAVIMENGGKIITSTAVKKIVVENGRVKGAELADGKFEVADQVRGAEAGSGAASRGGRIMGAAGGITIGFCSGLSTGGGKIFCTGSGFGSGRTGWMWGICFISTRWSGGVSNLGSGRGTVR